MNEYTQEAQRMAAIIRGEWSPECEKAVKQFHEMFSRAINEGQMMTPERVEYLWPLIREVNDEIDEDRRESEILESIYGVSDRVINAFAALLEARDALPADVHKKIYGALTEWVGDVDASLSGDALRDHLTESVGRAVTDGMLERAGVALQKAA